MNARGIVPAIATLLLAACGGGHDPSPFSSADGSVSEVSIEREGHTLRPNLHFSFEDSNARRSPLVTAERVRTGGYALQMDGEEYSPPIKRRAGDVADGLASVACGFWLYCEDTDPRISIVLTVERGDGEQVAWFGKDLKASEHTPGKWERFNAEFLMRETPAQPDDSLVLYIWNRDEEDLSIDDMDLFFISTEVPGRELGSAAHLDSLAPGQLPLPFAQCGCTPFQALAVLQQKLIGQPSDSAGEVVPHVALWDGFSWFYTPGMAVAEIRNAQDVPVAVVRPFCSELGVDLLSYERVVVRNIGQHGVHILSFDVDMLNGRSVVARKPPPVAAELTISLPTP